MISVIITAYNVSKTIKRTIQSVLDLEYTDFELLIINDCSIDNTLDIINKFNDPRIRVINNDINLGAGMGRRIGTKEAKGEYTAFLDGDDVYEKDYLKTLYDVAIKTKADMVSSGINLLDEDYNLIKLDTTGLDLIIDKKPGEIINHQSWTTRFLNNKLIKRELWDLVDYSDRRFIEDTLTCFFLFWYIKRLVILKYSGYDYILVPTSLMHGSSKEKHFIYQALCAKDICEFLKDKDEKIYKDGISAFLFRINELKKLNLKTSIYNEELKELFLYYLSII